MHEELGLAAVDLGPCIWTRRHAGMFRGSAFDQAERWYLGRTAAFTPAPPPGPDPEHGLDDMRWWTLAELLAATAETFTPRRLPELMRALLAEGPAAEPFDAGV